MKNFIEYYVVPDTDDDAPHIDDYADACKAVLGPCDAKCCLCILNAYCGQWKNFCTMDFKYQHP